MGSIVKKLTTVTLGVCVLGSAFAVIYTKFLHRKYFVELQVLFQERDELQVEWQKLRLEQSTWVTQGRVETVAKDQLGLVYPAPDEIVIIKQ